MVALIDENEVVSPCKIVIFRHRDTPPAQMLSSSQKAPTYIEVQELSRAYPLL